MGPILESAGAGQLWIADRNFCTRSILAGWHVRGSAFLVCEHAASPNPVELDRLAEVGHVPTGVVYEQTVSIQSDEGSPIVLRRIELRLDAPTEDGDSTIRLLSNLPADQFPGQQIAQLYRRRWKIEALFQRLESVLQSEIVALGNPRAAFLAFGVAAVAYNALAVIATAIRIAHRLDWSQIELSAYFIAIQIKAHYAGMMMAVLPDSWQPFQDMSASQLAKALLKIASYANPQALRKHPRAPKKPTNKTKTDPASARKHVSTARVLNQARNKK